MAPAFSLEVAGTEVEYGVTQFIESVEYESADGIADVMRVRAVNPDFLISDAKVFQPGNEMAVWMGYGTELEFVGRVIIAKQVPNFPQDGMPTIQIVGYTKDSFMMDNEPPKPKKEGGKGGRIFTDALYSDAVNDRASDYDFTPEIDDTEEQPHNFIQKPGISDYAFVKGLANLTGYVFWVDGDEDGVWTLHFIHPDTVPDLQDKKYTFVYNQADDSTLLTFQPEFLIKGAITDLKVISKDIRTGTVLESEITEESNAAPDVDASDPTGTVEDTLTTASDVKLFFNNYSFNVNTNRRFKTQAEVEAWAKQWFRRMRENFVLSRGRVIGVGSLRARQTHALDGVGKTFNGDYYFTKVKHICSKDQGYVVDFNARKVVP